MNIEFFAKHENGISIAANLSALVAAFAGVASYLLSASPWLFAGVSFIGLVIALVALAMARKNLSKLEDQSLSIAKDYLEFSSFVYQDSLRDRKPTYTETGYLIATLMDIRKQMGKDTSDLSDLLEKLMSLESERPSRK